MALTNDEAELYDRQIRLWGVNAQNKIRQSKVLMLGFNGVASEVAKILVLAGIDSLTIVDDQKLQDSDIHSNLFCRPPANGQRTHEVVEKLKKLNPLVKVDIDNSPISARTPDSFKGYDLVSLHSFMPLKDIENVDAQCRLNKIKFYLVLDFGFFGFMFNDLGPDFSVTVETQKPTDNAVSVIENDNSESGDEDSDRPTKRRRVASPSRELETETKFLPYSTFREMISLRNNSFDRKTSPVLFLSVAMMQFFNQEKHLPRPDDEEDAQKLRNLLDFVVKPLNLDEKIFKKLDQDWIENIFSSISPVCAVVGGVAGQDMIRALSDNDVPLNNTFSFDGISMTGVVERIATDESKSLKIKNVVMDYLDIADDDDDDY